MPIIDEKDVPDLIEAKINGDVVLRVLEFAPSNNQKEGHLALSASMEIADPETTKEGANIVGFKVSEFFQLSLTDNKTYPWQKLKEFSKGLGVGITGFDTDNPQEWCDKHTGRAVLTRVATGPYKKLDGSEGVSTKAKKYLSRAEKFDVAMAQ